MELTTVTDHEAIFFDGVDRIVVGDLPPDTELEVLGHDVRTLPAPGELLARFATVNDVHFGETEAGRIDGADIGPVCSVPPGAEPYPEVMNRGAVAEMAAVDPEVVVVKGDLTANGTAEEYRRFLEVYGGAFGERLVHVRGNHDSYHGGGYAAWPAQEVHLEGLTIALLDTSRDHRVNGALSVDQLEWLDELAVRVDQPVLALGHHPVWDPDVQPRRDDTFGIVPDDSEALFEVLRRRRNVVAYGAGHTHRNHRRAIAAAGGAHCFEVACVKDFPGAWVEYRVYERALVQVFRRIATPEALAWSEQTRHMYEGGYAAYAFGHLADRCFAVDTDTRALWA